MREKGKRIVYTEEAVISKSTKRSKAYSVRNDSIAYGLDWFKYKPVNLVAAILQEYGLEYCVRH